MQQSVLRQAAYSRSEAEILKEGHQGGGGKRRLLTSTWLLAGTAAENLVQFVVFSILARLLPVEQFGVVAFLVVILDFSRIFVFGGLLQAVVRMKQWDDYVASVCFTTNLLYAIIFAAALTFVGGPILSAHFYPGSETLMPVLSLVLIVDAAGAVHLGRLRWEFAFKRLAWRGLVANALGGTIAIAMALSGFGIWALIAHRLLVSLALSGTVWYLSQWRPRLVLSWSVTRELAPFTVRTTLSDLSVIVSNRATDFAVAVVLGPAAVAFYRVGGRVMEAITKMAIMPLQTASFAVLARVRDDRAIGSALVRLVSTLSAVALPVYIGSAVASEDIIELLMGPKYIASGWVMAAISIGAIPYTLSVFALPALLASGDAKSTLRSNVLSSVSRVVFSFGFAHFGILAAAWGNAASQLISAPYPLLRARDRLGTSLRAIGKHIWAPLWASLLMGIVLLVLRFTILRSLPLVPRLAFTVTAGAVIYPSLLLAFARNYVRHLLAELESLLPSRVSGMIPQSLRS